MAKISKIILVAVSIFVAHLSLRPNLAHANSLVLAPFLAHELNLILKASDVLHQSLVSQDEEQIEMGLRDVIWQIDKARSTLRLAKPHERGHLIRILDAAQAQFEQTQSAYGESRRSRLVAAYNQIVNLVRIYKLDRSYAIYFCAKDRTTWVQKGARAQNPFTPDVRRQPCGMRVPR